MRSYLSQIAALVYSSFDQMMVAMSQKPGCWEAYVEVPVLQSPGFVKFHHPAIDQSGQLAPCACVIH